MSTNIFLGYPPENIKNWIIENYQIQNILDDPVCFTANNPGEDATISFKCNTGFEDFYDIAGYLPCFIYSIDGKQTWNDWDFSEIHLDLCMNNQVFIKAKYENIASNPNLNGFSYTSRMCYFNINKSVSGSGLFSYLLTNNGIINNIPHNFYDIFGYSVIRDTLTSAPKFPQIKPNNGCYSGMFSGYKNLSYIEVLFTEWDDAEGWQNSTDLWLDGVSPTGTFVCPPELPEKRGPSYIPDGWTIIRK